MAPEFFDAFAYLRHILWEAWRSFDLVIGFKIWPQIGYWCCSWYWNKTADNETAYFERHLYIKDCVPRDRLISLRLSSGIFVASSMELWNGIAVGLDGQDGNETVMWIITGEETAQYNGWYELLLWFVWITTVHLWGVAEVGIITVPYHSQ
jgi:hypothetical protein